MTTTSFVNRRELIQFLQSQFAIDRHGHHGISHWARVRANGLMLCPETGANTHVVELFSFFHDSRRVNEHVDDGHGTRGAELAAKLKGRFFEATDEEMDMLTYACQKHSDGLNTGDATVLTCWDSDRLDLGRVGITPNPKYLCTAAAKNSASLAVAHSRALAWTYKEPLSPSFLGFE
jgi:uncharacterized protein